MPKPLPAVAPPRRRKSARRAELMAAALELFVEKGFSATRLEDIAASAGVSKGTVYLYFPSKDDLFKAVIQEGIVPVVAGGQTVAEQYTGDTPSLLREILLGWWHSVGTTSLAGIPKLMISEARNFPSVAEFYYDNVCVPGQRLIGDVLKRGIARGEFRPIDVDSAIEIVFAPLMMMTIWRFSLAACCHETSPNPLDLIDQHLDILLNGLTEEKS